MKLDDWKLDDLMKPEDLKPENLMKLGDLMLMKPHDNDSFGLRFFKSSSFRVFQSSII
jgi:hypothetical protein